MKKIVEVGPLVEAASGPSITGFSKIVFHLRRSISYAA
jgi:hypothetical protein